MGVLPSPMNGFNKDRADANNDGVRSLLYEILTFVAASMANSMVSATIIPIG